MSEIIDSKDFSLVKKTIGDWPSPNSMTIAISYKECYDLFESAEGKLKEIYNKFLDYFENALKLKTKGFFGESAMYTSLIYVPGFYHFVRLYMLLDYVSQFLDHEIPEQNYNINLEISLWNVLNNVNDNKSAWISTIKSFYIK